MAIDLYLVLDILVIVALLILAFTVLVKNTHDKLHRVFALFVLCISVWIISNYISNDIDNSPEIAVIANYFVFSFSYAAGVFLLRFVTILTNDEKIRKILRYAYAPLILITLLSATPLVVAGVSLQGQLYAVEFGPLAPIYFITLITNIGLSIYVVRKNKKLATGKQRDRLNVILKSLYLTFPVLIIAQAVIPAVTGWFGLTNIGVLPMLILVYGLYYSVVKYRLFDLRLIIVRSVAYAATLATILTLYGVITHSLTEFILSIEDTFTRDLVNGLLIVTAVFSFGFLKRIFDKLTNKLFYRDAYETQELLNEFNQAIVSTIDLDQLLSRAGEVIEKYLKPETITFALRDTKNDTIRIIADKDLHMSKEALEQIRAYVHKSAERLIITDVLEDAQKELKQLLQEANIGVLARITTNVDVEGNGYIVMGYKKSGNMYNSQDIAAIEIAANELAIAIQNALQFEEIQKFNVTLQEQIEQATKKMQKTNEKLRAMDETKDEFISMASHQLRTPLTSVKGYLSMVIEGDAGDLNEMQHKLLDQAFVSSQRMVYLIADLLNVSRLRTGKFIIEAAPTNLADVIQGEVEQLVEAAGSRGLTLKYDKPENFPTLMLDETKVRQVIMNFIDNAIYYTPTGGNITVNLKDLGQSVEYTVVDDGIGVPKSEQYHMFSKFYRAENAKKARPDGTGLGLFMARKVIVAQGGSIVFKSAEGKGSTFGFTFAKDKLAAVANNEK